MAVSRLLTCLADMRKSTHRIFFDEVPDVIEPGDKPRFTVTELVFDVPLAEEFCVFFHFGVVSIHLHKRYHIKLT